MIVVRQKNGHYIALELVNSFEDIDFGYYEPPAAVVLQESPDRWSITVEDGSYFRKRGWLVKYNGWVSIYAHRVGNGWEYRDIVFDAPVGRVISIERIELEQSLTASDVVRRSQEYGV
jgi:hypothetical protein